MLLCKPLHRSPDNPIQHRRREVMCAGISAVCLCLLVLCAPVAARESDAGADSADTATTDAAGKQEKADPKQEDILDRVFSPLDNAVSDINRDLNEGDGSGDPESSE